MITLVKNVGEANFITHAGAFHADEVMATVILSKCFDLMQICRVFKIPENLYDDVLVYDIGGGKYDHHQKGGNGQRSNGIPYAACGLIWREYGQKIIKNCEPNISKLVWKIIDRNLIQGIDATDNGVSLNSNYAGVQAMTISKAISQFNPSWNSDESTDDAFEKAVKFAEIIFDNALKSAIATAQAQSIADEAIESTDGSIMVLNRFVPWQEALFASKNPKARNILFVVFPSNRGGFNVQCVPDVLGGHGQRKPLPIEWRGVKAEELQKVTGVSTASFCHPAGFICAADTVDDALLLAMLAAKA